MNTAHADELDSFVATWRGCARPSEDAAQCAAAIRAFARARAPEADPGAGVPDAVIVGLEMIGSPWTFAKAMKRPARERRRGCAAMLVIALVLAVPMMLISGEGEVASNPFLSILLVMGIGIGAIVVFSAISKARLRSAREWRRCHGCRYSLRGLQDEVPPADLGGVVIGPRLCPECGRRWPMLA